MPVAAVGSHKYTLADRITVNDLQPASISKQASKQERTGKLANKEMADFFFIFFLWMMVEVEEEKSQPNVAN